jgi:hypothetical protein
MASSTTVSLWLESHIVLMIQVVVSYFDLQDLRSVLISSIFLEELNHPAKDIFLNDSTKLLTRPKETAYGVQKKKT